MKAALEAEKVALSNALATFADASLIFFAHGASLSSCACCKPTFKRLHRFSKASHFCGRLGGRSVKALDSIHVAKARREQEAVGKNEKPIKAVDSIAVTKARREDKDRNEILMDTWIFEVCKMRAFSPAPPPKKTNYCTKRQKFSDLRRSRYCKYMQYINPEKNGSGFSHGVTMQRDFVKGAVALVEKSWIID